MKSFKIAMFAVISCLLLMITLSVVGYVFYAVFKEEPEDNQSQRYPMDNGTALGNIIVPSNITKIAFRGDKGQFSAIPKDSRINIPEGKYLLQSWQIERKDKNGVLWRLDATNSNSKTGTIEVVANRDIKLNIGEPIISTLDFAKEKNAFSFSQNLTGKMGEKISIYRDNKKAEPPKLRIRSKTGNYDQTFNFEYG